MLVTRDVSGFRITNLVKGRNCVNPHHDRHVFATSILSDRIVGPSIIGAYPQEDVEQRLEIVRRPILDFTTITKDLSGHERNSSLASVKLVNEFNGCCYFHEPFGVLYRLFDQYQLRRKLRSRNRSVTPCVLGGEWEQFDYSIELDMSASERKVVQPGLGCFVIEYLSLHC